MSLIPTTDAGSSSLLPTTTSSVPSTFSRVEGKSLVRAQNTEVAGALVKATRLAGAGYVAGVGVNLTGMLSREAAFQSDGSPQTQARLDHIVDSFAEYAGNTVRSFGTGWSR